MTSAGQGIGCAIACRLARDGHDVAIVDIAHAKEKVADVIKEIEGYGRKAISVVAGACPREPPRTAPPAR